MRLSRLRRLGAACGLVLGALILLGYAADYEPAWRLAPNLPATHPLSALCLALLGFGLLASHSTRPTIRLAAGVTVVAAAAIVVLRLLAPRIGTYLFDAIIPFGGVVAAQTAAGKPIFMGPNSAHSVLLIAMSEMLRWRRWQTASQLVACCAMGQLFLAVTGYVDQLHTFYGKMAPLTAVGLLMLTISLLCATPPREHGRPSARTGCISSDGHRQLAQCRYLMVARLGRLQRAAGLGLLFWTAWVGMPPVWFERRVGKAELPVGYNWPNAAVPLLESGMYF